MTASTATERGRKSPRPFRALRDLIRDPREAFITAEYVQHVEDRRRGGSSRERSAQRLRDASKLHARLFGAGARRGFQRRRLPRIKLCEAPMKRSEMLPRIAFQKLRRLLIDIERARNEQVTRR